MPVDYNALNQSMQTATAASGQMLAAKTNKKDRKFAEMMSNRQREWAIDDWNRNNLYNSPEQQMARFKAAGLNPNLIYGQQSNAAPIRSSDTPQNFRSNREMSDTSGLQNALMSGYDMNQKSAQTDLVAKQIELMEKEIMYKDTQILTKLDNTKADTALKNFNLSRGKSLWQFDLQSADLKNQKLDADISYTLDQNDRAALTNAMELQKGQMSIMQGAQAIIESRMRTAKTEQEVQNLKQTLQNLRYDGDVKKLDSDLAKMSIRPGDPFWASAAARAIKLAEDAKKSSPRKQQQSKSYFDALRDKEGW